MSKSRRYAIPGTTFGSKYVFSFNDKQQLEGIKKQTKLGRPLRSIKPGSPEFEKAASSSQALNAYNVNKYKGDKNSYKQSTDDIEKASNEELEEKKTTETKKETNEQYVDNDFSVPASPKYTTTYPSGSQLYAYPLDIDLEQDHLKITRYEYRRESLNASFPDQTETIDGETIKRDGGSVLGQLVGSIILPMPKATDTNGAEWGKSELNAQGMAALNLAAYSTGVPGETKEEADKREQMFREYKDQTGNDDAVVEGIGAIKNQIAAKLSGMLLGTELNADTVLARKGGTVLNPNAEMLFQGPVLRDFSFKYRMVARSKDEGKSIRNIIKFLKTGMAPKFRSSTYLKSPDVFTLQYKNGTKENDILKTVNRFSPGGLALTTLGTDYAPNTYWSAYDDSQPVEITMDLSFAELRPIYEQDQMSLKGDNVGY